MRVTTVQLHEAELQVEYEYEPYRPGRYSGPPEDCFPSEGGYVCIWRVLVNGAWLNSDVFAEHWLEKWEVQLAEECMDEEEA